MKVYDESTGCILGSTDIKVANGARYLEALEYRGIYDWTRHQFRVGRDVLEGKFGFCLIATTETAQFIPGFSKVGDVDGTR